MSAHLNTELDTLLALRAACGLDESESVRLRSLLDADPAADHQGFDRAAAALMLALEDKTEPMPVTLEQRLQAAGDEWCASHAVRPAPLERPDAGEVVQFPFWRSAGPAWAAAAVAVVAAALAWFPGLRGVAEAPADGVIPSVAPVAPVAAPTAAEARAELIAAGGDVVAIDWSVTEDPTAGNVTGDVVWSAAQQRGFMRFAGLQVNDSANFQYQLWIFDSARDERYPVDGGVFNIDTNGEVIVPIRPTLPVTEATLFAVTVEQPGGVVVSSRERISVLASVGAP